MVRSFQISAVFPHLSVRENVRVALQRRLGTSFHFWRSAHTLDRLHPKADEILEAVGLPGYGDLMASELPYEIGRASCRERVCAYGKMSVVSVSNQQKKR